MELAFYIWENDSELGPYSLTQMRSIWASGRITMKTMIRQDTDTDWKEAGEFDIFFVPNAPGPEPKSKPQKVIVTDFEMTFGSMVVFMCKWAIAVIPAALILFGIFLGVAMMFGLLGAVMSGISGR
jgi:hypothetical protein